MTLISVFGGGLFIIPLGFLLGSIISFYKGYDATKGTGKFLSSGGAVFGIMFLLFAIGSAIWMYLEK